VKKLMSRSWRSKEDEGKEKRKRQMKRRGHVQKNPGQGLIRAGETPSPPSPTQIEGEGKTI
jgi:hypothetical protein